jgi:uncharacterized protein (UPF0261 family)
VRRAEQPEATAPPEGEGRAVRGFTRWNAADTTVRPQDRLVANRADVAAEPPSLMRAASALSDAGRDARVLEFPVAATTDRAAYVAGTFDTKGRELFYLQNCLDRLGLRTVTVDLSTSGKPSPAQIHPREVARHHPEGERAVMTGDRGTAVAAMAVAFEHFVLRRRDLGGIISAGGSGGTALATAAMRRLPIGVPKMMVSTVASGDVRPYVGPADICMMYSVTDVSGINSVSERVLGNAAHALAGMITQRARPGAGGRRQADHRHEHVRGHDALRAGPDQAPGGSLQLPGLPRDRHGRPVDGEAGRVRPGQRRHRRDDDRDPRRDRGRRAVGRAAAARCVHSHRVPYVGSCGALDMVNFWAIETVPPQFRNRNLYKHNQNVTLMRTTVEECVKIGRFIVDKLNRMEGPVRFLLPEGGVSLLDAPGKPFWDPAADKALFDTIATNFRSGTNRKLVRLPHNVNDDAFVDALIANFTEVVRDAPARLQSR